MDFLTWADGEKSLLEISNNLKIPMWETIKIAKKLKEEDLIILKKI